jgi:hypothetical protein
MCGRPYTNTPPLSRAALRDLLGDCSFNPSLSRFSFSFSFSSFTPVRMKND